MKQIFVVHGGDAFNSYDEFFSNLKTKEVSLEMLKSIGWKQNLQKNLGNEFVVLNPRMPNAQNARYTEWKIWFEKLIPFIEDGVIFAGHSLGAIFLAKYLSEDQFPKKIRATLLVGAPFNTATHHPLADFVIDPLLSKLQEQAGDLYLFHSEDDSVVPYENAKLYEAALPKAHLVTFIDRGHFNSENFPEIEEVIKKL